VEKREVTFTRDYTSKVGYIYFSEEDVKRSVTIRRDDLDDEIVIDIGKDGKIVGLEFIGLEHFPYD